MAIASFIEFLIILGLTNNQNLLLLMHKTELRKQKILLRLSIINIVALQILSILQLRQCKLRFKILKLRHLIPITLLSVVKRLRRRCWTTKLRMVYLKLFNSMKSRSTQLVQFIHYNILLPINNYRLYCQTNMSVLIKSITLILVRS